MNSMRETLKPRQIYTVQAEIWLAIRRENLLLIQEKDRCLCPTNNIRCDSQEMYLPLREPGWRICVHLLLLVPPFLPYYHLPPVENPCQTQNSLVPI